MSQIPEFNKQISDLSDLHATPVQDPEAQKKIEDLTVKLNAMNYAQNTMSRAIHSLKKSLEDTVEEDFIRIQKLEEEKVELNNSLQESLDRIEVLENEKTDLKSELENSHQQNSKFVEQLKELKHINPILNSSTYAEVVTAKTQKYIDQILEELKILKNENARLLCFLEVDALLNEKAKACGIEFLE